MNSVMLFVACWCVWGMGAYALARIVISRCDGLWTNADRMLGLTVIAPLGPLLVFIFIGGAIYTHYAQTPWGRRPARW